MLSRFGRWALGLYPPSVPADLRLTDVQAVNGEHSQIVAKVEITDADRRRFQAYQQQQHATRNQLGILISEREVIEVEQGKQPDGPT